VETLFECANKITVKMQASRFRHYAWLRWGIMLLSALLYCYLTYPIIFLLESDPSYWPYVLFGLFFLVFAVFFPEINAFLAIRRYKKETDNEALYCVRFGDHIEVLEGKICILWEYSEITSVVRLKYTYELKKGKSFSVLIDPDSFTKGTFEDFKVFLKEKRPDLNIPD